MLRRGQQSWVVGSIASLKSNMKQLGLHLIADFVGSKYLTDVSRIKSALISAADASCAVVLHTSAHQFPDSDGVTGVVTLAASHISIHTWPEHDYMALDIFMCGDSDPYKALEYLESYFEPKEIKTQSVVRGAPGIAASA